MEGGKKPSLTLRGDYGVATFDKTTHQAVYPDTVSAEALKRIARGGGKGKGSGGKGSGARRDGVTGNR